MDGGLSVSLYPLACTSDRPAIQMANMAGFVQVGTQTGRDYDQLHSTNAHNMLEGGLLKTRE